jgi:hypothetical protein
MTRVDRLAEGDVAVVLKPLEFIKVIDRYEYRCGLPVLRQHNTFMAAPGTVDQFGEMTAGLRNRTHKRHSSTVRLDADGCRYGAPTAAAQRRGPFRERLPAKARMRLRASQGLPNGHDRGASHADSYDECPGLSADPRQPYGNERCGQRGQVTAVSPRPLPGLMNRGLPDLRSWVTRWYDDLARRLPWSSPTMDFRTTCDRTRHEVGSSSPEPGGLYVPLALHDGS